MKIVNENDNVLKSKSKQWYDRRAKKVVFQTGDKVLLLLPLIGKPLQARFCGPYEVLQRLGEVDYMVGTHDRRKSKRVVHVNLMKKFIERTDDTEVVEDV